MASVLSVRTRLSSLDLTLRYDWGILGAQDQTSSAFSSMKGSSGTHPLSVTTTNPLQPSSLHKPGQTREPVFYALYSHGQSELLFQSRDQLQRHRSAQKELFTERPVNQGDGFTQWPTSCHGHDIYQSQWTKYFVASLSSLQQLSAAVVYNRRPLPEHPWSGHNLTNYTRGVIDHLCVTAEFKPFGGRAGMVRSV